MDKMTKNEIENLMYRLEKSMENKRTAERAHQVVVDDVMKKLGVQTSSHNYEEAKILLGREMVERIWNDRKFIETQDQEEK